MNTADELEQYTKLITNNTIAQTKVSGALDSALARLTEEERKYREFNTSGIMRYKAFLQPIFVAAGTIVVLALCAFIFVSTGHPINIKAGDYEINSN